MHPRQTEGGIEDRLTSLVFPAYNPGAQQTERTWAEVRRFLDESPGRWEVLFVCDGCTDGTPERLAALTRNDSARVRVLSHSPNRGKGYAVRYGLSAACGAYRLFTDFDLAYGWDDLLRVARTLWDGAEAAAASRTHPESRLIVPVGLQGYAYRRHIQSVIFGALARMLLPLKQTDTQAGLKGISARAAWLVLPHLHCDGFGFDCELLTACARYRLPVVEVPVQVRIEDQSSTTGARATWQMIGELLKIRREWRRTPPPLAMPMEGPERITLKHASLRGSDVKGGSTAWGARVI
jgi:dolichyl-phosphate beta-glucosyltransferase